MITVIKYKLIEVARHTTITVLRTYKTHSANEDDSGGEITRYRCHFSYYIHSLMHSCTHMRCTSNFFCNSHRAAAASCYTNNCNLVETLSAIHFPGGDVSKVFPLHCAPVVRGILCHVPPPTTTTQPNCRTSEWVCVRLWPPCSRHLQHTWI